MKEILAVEFLLILQKAFDTVSLRHHHSWHQGENFEILSLDHQKMHLQG